MQTACRCIARLTAHPGPSSRCSPLAFSAHLFGQPIRPSVCLPVCLSFGLSVRPSVCLPVCSSFGLSIASLLHINWPVCLCLSVCLPACSLSVVRFVSCPWFYPSLFYPCLLPIFRLSILFLSVLLCVHLSILSTSPPSLVPPVLRPIRPPSLLPYFSYSLRPSVSPSLLPPFPSSPPSHLHFAFSYPPSFFPPSLTVGPFVRPSDPPCPSFPP